MSWSLYSELESDRRSFLSEMQSELSTDFNSFLCVQFALNGPVCVVEILTGMSLCSVFLSLSSFSSPGSMPVTHKQLPIRSYLVLSFVRICMTFPLECSNLLLLSTVTSIMKTSIIYKTSSTNWRGFSWNQASTRKWPSPLVYFGTFCQLPSFDSEHLASHYSI